MGRRRKSNPLNLPPRVYAKHGAFYYHHPGGKWKRIGTKRAAEIVNSSSDGFGKVPYWFDEFIAHCRQRVAIGDLAPRTLEDYIDAGERLKVWFKDFYPAGIEPHHVGDYLDKGLEMGRAVRANREKAALSVMFTWLIRKGYAGVRTNPCARIKRNKETKRERYVENDEMSATLIDAPVQVWALAHLVYRTLQRPEDIIAWTPRNITERRDASGEVVRIDVDYRARLALLAADEVTPEIDAILARLKAEPARKADSKRGQSKVVTGLTLIHRRDGKPYSYDGLCAMLKHRQAAVRKQNAEKGSPLAEMAPWGYYDMKGKGAPPTCGWPACRSPWCRCCAATTRSRRPRSTSRRWRGIVAPNQVAFGV
jgi:integrase